MKKKWIAGIIIYIALLAASLIVVYAVPSLKGMLEKTYVTEYGKIDIEDEVSAYIVRDETVYVAGQDSEVRILADTNVLTKARTKIVELTPIIDESVEAAKETGPDADQAAAEAAAQANGESPDNVSRKYVKLREELGDDVIYSENGKSKTAGYISFFIDGAENSLSTDKIDDLSKSDYDDLTSLRKVSTATGKCGKGDPIFKVTNNSKWYLVFYIDNNAGKKYYEGRNVTVELADKEVSARVKQVQEGKDATKVILSCKTFFEGFLEERSLKTTVTVASAEGLVLQDSSIVKKGEQIGVFVKNKLGEHKFKPISIKADDGERCVVYSDIYVDEEGNFVETIKTYDEIVAEPTEEEIAELQVQAAEEAKQEAEEKAAAEKAAAEKAAAEAAAEERAAAQAAAQAAAEEEAAEQADADKEESGDAEAAAEGEKTEEPETDKETSAGTEKEDSGSE